MELQSAIFLAAGVFALLQFGFLPRLKKTWARLPLDKQIKRFGILAILDKLCDYSLIALICLGIFTLFIYILAAHTSSSADGIQHVLERVRSAKETLAHFKKSWTAWVFFVSFLLLWAAWYRSAKRYAKDTLTELRRKEYERLAKLRDEQPEDWEDLPPNPQMKEVWEHLQARLQEMETPRTPAPSAEERVKQVEYIERLSMVWTFMDFDRRLEIPWETEEVSATGFLGGIRRFLTSRGFLSDMKGVGKLLSHATFGLLTLSMIGFAAISANESLKERMAHLSDLEISTAAVESQVALRAEEEKAKPDKSRNNQSFNTNDSQHIRRLSKHLAREIRSENHWSHADHDLRSEAAKESIRENAVLASAATVDKSQTQDVPDLGHAATAEDILASQIETRITEEAKKNPGFLEKIRLWAVDRYHEPAEIDELRSFFVEQVVDVIFEPIPKPKAPWADKATDLVTDAVKNSASKIVELNANRFMVDVMRDVPAEATWAGARDRGSIDVLLSPELTERLRAQYPTAATQKTWADALRKMRTNDLSKEDAAVSADITQAIARMPVDKIIDDPSSFAELVSTYESQFPLEEKTYSRDHLFAYLSDIRKQAKDAGLEVADVQDSDPVQTRTTRTGDVEALRNYSRVGGVLIGASPRKASPIHVQDITWSIHNGSIEINLTRADGSSVLLGPFDAETVNRALAYAVDGRPVAVTVLNAEIIDREQVMMHPALRDSLFGAQVGRADEWIFDFLDPDVRNSHTPLRKEELALYGTTGLYNVALSFVKSGKADPVDGSFDKLRSMTQESDFALLSTKKGLDARLLGIAKACFQASSSAQEYGTCVQTRTQNSGLKKVIAALPKPRTAVVSQIFEQPYDLDSNLDFLHRSPANDQLWPLQFTVQMTINDQDHVTVSEFEGNQRAQSTQAVLVSIEDHGETLILKRLQDFTILQRFFRVALSGQLGEDFPVEKLGELARATKQPAASCPTPRWLRRAKLTGETTESEVAKVMRETPASAKFLYPERAELAGGVRTRMASCSAFLDSLDAEFAPASLVENKCKLFEDPSTIMRDCAAHESNRSEACILLNSQLNVSVIVGIHKIREDLAAVRAPSEITATCHQTP
jgi:hypothetical protein